MRAVLGHDMEEGGQGDWGGPGECRTVDGTFAWRRTSWKAFMEDAVARVKPESVALYLRRGAGDRGRRDPKEPEYCSVPHLGGGGWLATPAN